MTIIKLDSRLQLSFLQDVVEVKGKKVIAERFRAWCEAGGFDLEMIRLAEASLFVSMMPLHKDHPSRMIAQFCAAVQSYQSLKEL